MTEEGRALLEAHMKLVAAHAALVQRLSGDDSAPAPRKQPDKQPGIEPDGTVETMLRACKGKAVTHWLLSEIKRRPGITREELNKARGIAYSKGAGKPANAQQSASAVGTALQHARDHAATHDFRIEGDDAAGYTLVGKELATTSEPDKEPDTSAPTARVLDRSDRWRSSPHLDFERLALDEDCEGNRDGEIWSEMFARFVDYDEMNQWADALATGLGDATPLRELADYYDAGKAGPYVVTPREELANFLVYLGLAKNHWAAWKMVDPARLPVVVKLDEKEN